MSTTAVSPTPITAASILASDDPFTLGLPKAFIDPDELHFLMTQISAQAEAALEPKDTPA